jgi:hypothetical protein
MVNKMYERDTLVSDLKRNIIEVTFNKVNGEQRVMRCTLLKNYLPENYDEGFLDAKHQENKDIVAVWDIQNGGWRSFRVENVTYVQVIDGAY